MMERVWAKRWAVALSGGFYFQASEGSVTSPSLDISWRRRYAGDASVSHDPKRTLNDFGRRMMSTAGQLGPCPSGTPG